MHSDQSFSASPSPRQLHVSHTIQQNLNLPRSVIFFCFLQSCLATRRKLPEAASSQLWLTTRVSVLVHLACVVVSVALKCSRYSERLWQSIVALHENSRSPAFMFVTVSKGHVCAFALGLFSALSIAVIVVCLKSNTTVWVYSSTPNASTLIDARNALDPKSQMLNTHKVPHILHQSWVNRTVPKQYSAWRQSWVKNHRHWEFKLWTDEDNDALVQEYMPWFLTRYEEYDQPVMRADAVRYLYMHRCSKQHFCSSMHHIHINKSFGCKLRTCLGELICKVAQT